MPNEQAKHAKEEIRRMEELERRVEQMGNEIDAGPAEVDPAEKYASADPVCASWSARHLYRCLRHVPLAALRFARRRSRSR